MMNLNNGVTVEAAYSGKRERRHVECVSDGDKVIDGPPITPDYPRRVEGMTDEAYQRVIMWRRTCNACGKEID
jgi:hypothetical protein